MRIIQLNITPGVCFYSWDNKNINASSTANKTHFIVPLILKQFLNQYKHQQFTNENQQIVDK